MRMMIAMTKPRPKFEMDVMIRSVERAKLALDRAVAALRADPGVRWFGGRITQEAVVSAVWLWMEEMGEEGLRDGIARQLPRLEAILRGEPDPGPAEWPVRYARAIGPGKVIPHPSADEPDDPDPAGKRHRRVKRPER
jgi:hypothetical protein